MPEIIIQNLSNKKVIYSDTSISVLKVLQNNQIDWMHACGGKGRCTTCKINVLKGYENISELSSFERKCKNAGLLTEVQRLACQCRSEGDILISVPQECKLPHMEYSD